MTPRPLHLFLLLGALLLPGLAPGDSGQIELIELNGRSAEELIPLLKPVVEPDGAITGTGYRLIVRGTDAQRREIHRLLEQLDRPPRRLLITVHMGQLSETERRGIEVGGRVDTGDAGAELGAPRSGQGASVKLHDTRSLRDADQRQQVQALEGEPAFIATGGERPYPSRVETWRGPLGGRGGAVEMQTVQATSGFYALARLRGDQVVVRISPQRESFDPVRPGAVEGQHIETTVSGPLGTWLPLGASGGTVRSEQQGIGHSASTAEQQTRPMWLKVDVLP